MSKSANDIQGEHRNMISMFGAGGLGAAPSDHSDYYARIAEQRQSPGYLAREERGRQQKREAIAQGELNDDLIVSGTVVPMERCQNHSPIDCCNCGGTDRVVDEFTIRRAKERVVSRAR